MSTRSVGPSAGYRWLTKGFELAFRHPKPLYGGAVLLLVACLLPTLVSLPARFAVMTPNAAPSAAMLGLTSLINIAIGLLLIPLYAGFLQIVDAVERGQAARAIDIIKPYRDGEALRLIGFGLAVAVIYVVLIVAVVVVTGGGIVTWYMQAIAAQAGHQLPPPLPDGFGLTVLLLFVVALVLTGFYAVSLGQIALNRRGVVESLRVGVLGAVKNLLPLLVYALSFLVVGIVVAIAILLIGLLLAVLGKLVGVWLVLVVVVPLYVALILTVMVVMFGVMYHLWLDVCGHDEVAAAPPPLLA